jgi:hypothetical protein
MEIGKAGERATADIREVLHRGHGARTVVEMCRITGVARSEIYRLLLSVRSTTMHGTGAHGSDLPT